jgi:hypothetical protein
VPDHYGTVKICPRSSRRFSGTSSSVFAGTTPTGRAPRGRMTTAAEGRETVCGQGRLDWVPGYQATLVLSRMAGNRVGNASAASTGEDTERRDDHRTWTAKRRLEPSLQVWNIVFA